MEKNPVIEASPIDEAKGAEIMEKYEKESRTRKFDAGWLVKLIYFICLAFTIYHLAYASGIRALQMVSIKHPRHPCGAYPGAGLCSVSRI